MKTSRRDFLQMAALSLGALGAGSSAAARPPAGTGISLIADPADSVASSQPAVFAIQQLMSAIKRHGVPVRRFESAEQAPSSDLCVVAAGADSSFAAEMLRKAGISMPDTAECLGLLPSVHNERNFLLACGRDARGLMYALLELADRVEYADAPLGAFKVEQAVIEQPFNEIRSIGRLFSSDIEDKPWFNDREMWREYFAMLATQRFNRFHLAFGIGHDFLTQVKDAYFLFAYPFLVSPPGYSVRAAKLPDDERDRNLETLQFISSQAVAHGIDFQLGIWTHGYHWMDSPNPNYTIEGLTPENHAAYSRDALAAVLRACPAISGVTLRTHGESGVREGSYAFWKTVFDGIPQSGRKIEIDLHTKGLDQKLIDSALATGMPVRLSPKYWAEHTGMPYQQAAIRELEMPREKVGDQGFFALSSGSRSFTRYGYADFLSLSMSMSTSNDRPYSVFFRIWPGVHRFLLWGDPALTAAHARAFRFCGARGVELFEPLSFKGRRGSGSPGGRCAYADRSLEPRRDWEKYLYTYRTWGRLLYDPEADPEVWRRYLRNRFQAGAPALESALANATRILPIVVTAHLPSAANDTYCPEFYTNQSIVDPSATSPYGDTPAPKVFGNVSPLDPQIFLSIHDFAAELLTSTFTGKYSPIEVAQWLEDLAGKAAGQLAEAQRLAKSATSSEFRRTTTDLKIQIGLGRFFAAKLRSGVLYAIHEQSGDRGALEEALKKYRSAREIWSGFVEEVNGVYVPDISYGPLPHQRGHWQDRLPVIDADVAAMAKRLESLPASANQSEHAQRAVQEALGRPRRASATCVHTSPSSLTPGKPLEITVSVNETAEPVSARLWYRHVDQAERYQSVQMQPNGSEYKAAIPADYTASKFPMQYYFEFRQGSGKAWLYPGFAPSLANQPYFVVGSRGKE
jgi:hypothetical protein